MNIFGDDGLCQFDVYPNWTDGEQGDLRPLHMEDGVSFPPTAYPVLGFIAPKIEFYGDFRCLRHNLLDITQHIVMPLPENLRHLQAGDGVDREGPAKKAPCGWLDHTHRAEDETEEGKLAISGLGAAKAACPGWAHRGRVSMIWTTLSIMSALRRSRPASSSNRIATLPSSREGKRPW